MNKLAMQSARHARAPMIIAHLAMILVRSHQIAIVQTAINISITTMSAKVITKITIIFTPLSPSIGFIFSIMFLSYLLIECSS